MNLRTALLTALALLGFASNSLLCRAALLQGDRIDPASFTLVRIASGAITLLIIVTLRSRRVIFGGSWSSAFALFAYAIAFSLAYVRLTTATGALILFGVVQLTMLTSAFRSGERPRPMQILGLLLASAGLVVLCAPGVRAPHPLAAASMAIAGVAWGIYSLRGRGVHDPLSMTAGNFVRAVPFAAIPLLFALHDLRITTVGMILAIASGALASGLGYTLWYSALPSLTATRASIVQLSVPVIAALAAVVVLNESLSLRVALAGVATLTGVLLAMRR